MPRMNGLDACRHIRRLDPGIRVVIVSRLSDDILAGGFACGAHAVVRKTDIAEQLPAAVLAIS